MKKINRLNGIVTKYNKIIMFSKILDIYRYAREVTHAIRYIALLCVTFSTGAVIFGYLTFMSVSIMYHAFVRKLLCIP